MSPDEALDVARQAGLTLSVRGDELIVQSPEPIPLDVLALLREHKPALIGLLSLNADTGSDSLTRWLAEPMPLHVEPATSRPTVGQLRTLAERLAAYIAAGHGALAQTTPAHEQATEARRRLLEAEQRLDALGHLVAALSGEPWDRGKLGRWCAVEAFRQGDAATVLEMVDAIGGDAEEGAGLT